MDIFKLWGQETKTTSTGAILAYHHFKPSYLQSDNVIVTHRHFDSRVINTLEEAKKQPYNITTLLHSKCRKNDQKLPPPFNSSLIQKRFISEPIPKHLRNKYLSHKCRFQVFPTNGVDLGDETVRPDSTKKRKITTPITETLNKINANLYGTTAYQRHFCRHLPPTTNQQSRPLSPTTNQESRHLSPTTNQERRHLLPTTNQERRKFVYFKDDGKICRKCNKIVNHKINKQSKKKDLKHEKNSCWPLCSPGVRNISNNSPSSTAIIFPKSCIHHSSKLKLHDENVCKCYHKVSGLISPSQFMDNDKQQCYEEEIPNRQNSGELQSNISSPLFKDNNEGNEGPANHNSFREVKKKSRIGSKLLSRKRMVKPECDFKTAAHRKYHQTYIKPIPDLRDAISKGKRHNFHGLNVYVFRG